MYSICVESRFSSSHYLQQYEGSCANLHGHNWRVEVEVRGRELGQNGMLMDFTVLNRELNAVTGEFDHTVINDHPDFKDGKINPTAETLARYIYDRLTGSVGPNQIYRVSVFETDEYVASYLPHDDR